jgi:hypothetical protein
MIAMTFSGVANPVCCGHPEETLDARLEQDDTDEEGRARSLICDGRRL